MQHMLRFAIRYDAAVCHVMRSTGIHITVFLFVGIYPPIVYTVNHR